MEEEDLMKTYSSVKAAGSTLMLVGVLIVFTACGGSGGGSADGGSVVFSLVLQNAPASASDILIPADEIALFMDVTVANGR